MRSKKTKKQRIFRLLLDLAFLGPLRPFAIVRTIYRRLSR